MAPRRRPLGVRAGAGRDSRRRGRDGVARLSTPAAGLALGPDELRRLLATAAAGARGVVLAIGPARDGPATMVLADEERKFTGDRAVYLLLAPAEPLPGLAPDGPAPFRFLLRLDGAERGIATLGALALALGSLAAGPLAALPRLLAVHAIAGHRPEAIATLAAALKPRAAFLWLHDFSTLCGNPVLLRNGLEFCHAPPPASMACRVCAHGEARAAHLARVRALLAAVPFTVVAASAQALALFRAAGLPARDEVLHPHTSLRPGPAAAVAPEGPVRVAFVGPQTPENGWPRLQALLPRIGDAAEFLAIPAATPAKPFAVAQALAERAVDFVAVLAPWPDPAPPVDAARAAGAEILAVAGTLPPGADILLFADDDALADFLRHDAAAHVRARRPHRYLRHLVYTGSTATLGAGAVRTDDPDVHLLLRGARLDARRDGDTWRFALPPAEPPDPRRTLRLRSRHLRGAWDRADSGDRRRLGIAVTALALDGAAVPPGDPRRAGGWHKPEPDWQWTDGDAGLLVGDARALDVTIRPLARYWRAPLLGGP